MKIKIKNIIAYKKKADDTILNFLNRILNIGRQEWGKVNLCFSLKFFYYGGHVIGHTVLISMFAKRIGIENLPFLFIADALFNDPCDFIFCKISK
jgi:hypothetical protein